MSGSLNRVMLIGNLGKDPEIRSTNDGREVANLVIATSENWVDKQSSERKEKTEWHRVSCFSPGLVNIIKNYLKKGSKVFIEGQLQTRKWHDQNGQERYTTEIVLQGYSSSLTMLDRAGAAPSGGSNYSEGSNEGGGYGGGAQRSSAPASRANDAIDDDIPF